MFSKIFQWKLLGRSTFLIDPFAAGLKKKKKGNFQEKMMENFEVGQCPILLQI